MRRATELNIYSCWGTFYQYVVMDGTFLFLPYVSTYVVVKSTPVTHYLQKEERKITGEGSYDCLTSTHKVIAVIITCATSKRERRQEGGRVGREATLYIWP